MLTLTQLLNGYPEPIRSLIIAAFQPSGAAQADWLTLDQTYDGLVQQLNNLLASPSLQEVAGLDVSTADAQNIYLAQSFHDAIAGTVGNGPDTNWAKLLPARAEAIRQLQPLLANYAFDARQQVAQSAGLGWPVWVALGAAVWYFFLRK